MKSRSATSGQVQIAFERRAERAELLAAESSSAAVPLRFAAGLYRVQGAVAAKLEASGALTGSLAKDAECLLPHLRQVLRYTIDAGPESLAVQAKARLEDDDATAQSRLLVYWNNEIASGEDYLSRSLLRPYVEVLASLRISPDRLHRPGCCPFCGGPAWISARRSDSTMDGARRILGCALCGGEWQANRGRCPCCSEENPEKLPSFHQEAQPSVRIEACDTCHRFVKSIDQTVDARSIPEVDDLLSVGMDLWAAEAGYTRLEPGLTGI